VISQEPTIRIGVVEGASEIRGVFKGAFLVGQRQLVEGEFVARSENANITLLDGAGKPILTRPEVRCTPVAGAAFVLCDVTIGINFHWERKEDQTFDGVLRLVAGADNTITAINEITVERYLESVISSEMSAEAPMELLKAHAITSRSWLVAMLERESRNVGVPAQRTIQADGELTRWYDREDHELFDVCADDHCQRYQGLSKIISRAASEAVHSTHGLFLVHGGEICDARFYKACGGRTELFENAWEDKKVPYLTTVCDAEVEHPAITDEASARKWVESEPSAWCNTRDPAILRQILPSFDQETTDFFRWKVEYAREELEALLKSKSGFDFGTLMDLVPLERGPSGRIFKLKIVGTGKTIVVGKELEIRRWLSKSHMYSSAFVVDTERDPSGVPIRFTFRGGGWGHGVGLCQIGAAVMASRGKSAEEIVRHYFPGAELNRLY
jgi:stage II sporulation protein D